MTREEEAAEFERLCDMFGVQRQCYLGTGQYGRGLLLKEEVMRDRLVMVPLQHTLCISDDPSQGSGGRNAAAMQDKYAHVPAPNLCDRGPGIPSSYQRTK